MNGLSGAVKLGSMLGLGCCFAFVACGNPYPVPDASGGTSGTGVGAGTGGMVNSSSGGSVGLAGGGASTATGGGGSTGIAGTSSGLGGSGGATAGGSSGGGTSSVGGSSVGGSSSGAGGSGAGSGAGGGPAGCPAGATFCDDFEASSTLGSAWTVDNTLKATIGVVSTYTTMPGPTMAHSGKNSVQVSFMGGTGYGMIVEKMGYPASPSATGYWGRVWLYAETPTDTGHDVYIEGSTGVASTLANNGIRPLNTQGKMTINTDPGANGEGQASTNMDLPRGAWTCFEWHITATGGTGDISLYVGGGMMAAATLKSQPIPALTEQRVGYERYNGTAAGNLWIDDYAIGSMRLGCM